MGVYNAAGQRITKAAFPTEAPPNVPLRVTADLFKTEDYEGRISKLPEGDKKTLLCRAGRIVTQRFIDDLFPPATYTSKTPSSGPAAGGTVVTITGTNLDGASGVTFGGTAGTAFSVVDRQTLRVTSPAKVAGVHPVVILDDAGNVPAGDFTYA